MHAYSILQILDCRESPWLERVAEAADSRRNFIPILKSDTIWTHCAICSDAVPHSRTLVSLGYPRAGRSVGTAGLFHAARALRKYPVYLVEQLNLTRNHPPACQPYLLYCEVRGIISDHASIEDAGCSLLDYLDSFKRARIFPLAGIYHFQSGRWERVRKLTS